MLIYVSMHVAFVYGHYPLCSLHSNAACYITPQAGCLMQLIRVTALGSVLRWPTTAISEPSFPTHGGMLDGARGEAIKINKKIFLIYTP